MYREYNWGMKKKIATKKAQKSISSTEDIKRYLGALAEDFQGRVSAIAEQFFGVNEKLDGVITRLDGVDGRLDGIDGRLDGIDGRLDGIDGRLDGIDGRLDGIDKKLDTHTQMIGQLMVDVQEIKTDLKQKVDRSEFSPLEKRVVALEMRPRATA